MPDVRTALPHPYIANTDEDRAIMLARLGLESVEQLFDMLPAALRDPEIGIPPALAEADLVRMLEERASENVVERPAFLGAGAYRRFVPAITAHLASRSEFATAYTPYQPEISQGTLQAGFEYQSVVCELTGMDVSNTGMYDVASATAEACLMAVRTTRRRAIALLEPIHPHTLDVVRTYAFGADAHVETVRAPSEVTEDHACLVVQQPDFLGSIQDIAPLADTAHAAGALCIVVADPLALGLLRAPGDAGADIVTGEGRDLAGPMAFGGPSLGLFAAREAFLRQMPGRIVGRARELHPPPDAAPDTPPRTGYVLTLQAREQFIRRARATSNFSTGQALVATAFTITLQALGPQGLRESAELCYQRAHDAARRITAIPGFEVVDRGPWFQEFLVRAPLDPRALARALDERGITGGLDVSDREEPEARDATLFCVTEATPPEHVDALVDALAEIGGRA
jgi:glycine dehydrogenase subunit 1